MAINPFDLARQLGGVPIGGGESKSADPIELARQLGGVPLSVEATQPEAVAAPAPQKKQQSSLMPWINTPVGLGTRIPYIIANTRPEKVLPSLAAAVREIPQKAKSAFLLGGADSLPESTSQLPPGMTFEELASMRMTPQDFWRSQGINSDEELRRYKEGKQKELKRDIRDADKRIAAATPDDLTVVERGIVGGGASLATNALGVTASVLTKSPGVGLAFAGSVTGLDSYGEARVEGASPQKAAAKASIDAAIEVAFERYGTKPLADILRKTGIGKVTEPDEIKSALARFAAREIPAEQLTTAAQSLNDVAFGLDQEMSNAQSIGEVLRIQGERQAVTLVSTIFAGGAQAGGLAAVEGATRTVQMRKLEGALRELETRKFDNEQERLEAYRSAVLKQATDIAAPTVRELRPEGGQPISPEQYGKTYASKVYGAVGNFIPGNTQFSVEKKETDGKTEFTVKDQSGRQYGQVFENDANANSFAEGLNELSRARAEGIKALEPLSASLRETLTGFGLNDIGLSLGNKVFNREGETLTSEGMYDPMVRRIFLAVDAIDPTGTLDTEQRRQALRGVLRHETVHALRNLDLWKNSEWKNLERAASTLRRPDNGKTYLENAQELYADQNAVIQVEEAVAELIRDVANRLPSIGGRPRTLSERAINFFDKTKNALTGAGFQTYEDVVRKFESGQVGSRQRDRIRTYRATEEYLASRPQNPVLPERIKSLLSTPQGRQEWRQDAVQSVMDKGEVDPAANPAAANAASINGLRESRSAIELVPQTIEVNGRKFPTRDSEGRLIYSGYEGEEVFGLPTLPTLEGLQRFWEFAGDTKIVDDAGRPLVYMHGTSADIVAFKPKQAASVFMARPPKFAEEFAYLSEDYMVGNFPDFIPDAQVLDALNESLRSGGGFTPKSYDALTKARDMAAQDISQGKGIRPAALNVIKDEAKKGASSIYLNSIMKRLPSGPNLMPVYINAKKPWDYNNPEHVNAVVKRARENGADVTGTMVQEIREGNWQTIEGSGDNAPILDAIRELGFDAMYVEEAGYKNLAVFDPAQIKSAIGNNGEFSPLTPSIRESRKSNQNLVDKVVRSFNQDSMRRVALLDYLQNFAAQQRVSDNVPSFEAYFDGPDMDIDRGVARYVERFKDKLPKPIMDALALENVMDFETGEAINAAADSLRGGHIAQLRRLQEEFLLTPSVRESRVRNPQIDTPEFKEFFRDSKVVDGSLTREGLGSGGNPLVVYHATNADIKAFRVGTQGGALGNGIYFSPSTSYVEQYAGAEGGNIIPAYVSIQNPLVIDFSIHPDPMVEALIRLGVKESSAERTVERAYDTKGYITNQVKKRAEDAGFDGIIQYTKDGRMNEVVAFYPTQVKSAIGNAGTFNRYSPDIRESRKGKPEVFYHGSKSGQPQVFDPTVGLTAGSWFTKNRAEAERFGDVGAYTVDVKSPASMQDFAQARREVVASGIDINERPQEFNAAVIKNLEEKGFDGIRDKAFAGAGGVGEDVVAAFRPGQIKPAPKPRKSINSLLKRYGIEPNNIIEAERMFADGMPMYAIHEQGGPPFEITSVEALRNYTTDQLLALPASVLGAKESRNASKDAFESKLIEDNRVPDFKSREKLIDMPIGDFLRLAKYGRYDPKYAETSRLLQAGKKFTSLPFLNLSLDEDGILKVIGHEGRHRAMALEDAGYTSMPVLLRTMDPNPIRWSEQNDPTKMDYVEDWPTAIEAQDSLFKVPMPVAREDSMTPYGGPSVRESRKSGKMGVDTQSNIERAVYEADRVAGQAGRAAEDLARRAGAVAFREARPSKPPVRPGAGRQRREQEVPSGRPREPVNIRPIQDGASTYAAVHYGNVADLAKLSGAKYGTGIRGAEAARLRNSKDARIKRRVYFYINKAGMSEPIRPEAGVGSNVYTQVFNNILGPGERMYEISEQAKNDNDFESLVIKNGFDGYAAPSKGMIVLLGVDAPVRYEGAVADMRAKGVSYREMTSLAARESRSQAPITNALRVARTGFKDYASSSQEQFFGNFWPKIIGSTLGQVSPNPENVRVAVEKSINDLRPWLARNPKYLDYYNKDFAATRRMLETKYGPLTEDQFMMFRLLSGLTSPSTELPDNISDALKAFDVWNQDGNFDSFVMGRSPKGNTVLMSAPFTLIGHTLSNKARTFKVIERLINEKGGVIKAVNFLKEQVPVRELHNFNREMGYSGPVGDIGAIKGLVRIATGQSELIPRMFIFGPKVGAYVLNMTGESRYNTVDIWESRLIRSYFTGLFSERYGLPENVSEHELFQDFISTFKEVFEQQTGKQWDSSALQAIRWFFIIDAARKAGYTEARTNETISEYVRRNIESPRASSPYRRGQGDEGIGREVPSIRESRPESERAGVRGGRGEGGGIAPLEGAPNVRGGGPIPEIVGIAERYAEESGIPYQRQPSYVEVDEARATRIAEAFEAMRHDPKNPEVLAAYRDMIRQTRAQYNALVDAGYKFTFFDGNTDPYNGNPWNAMRDLRDNKSMAVYGTYDGYGTAGITDSELENNPMLEDTGIRWLDQNGVSRMVTANDLFRAVHDAFGHGIEGAGFRARGEENAWQAHARLFTGPALAALTSETRGQNSWLNFNPKPFREIVGDEKAKQLHPDNWETITAGEHNRTAQLFDTVFAENKIGMMPEWTWQEGFDAPKPRESRVRMSVGQGTPIGPQQPGPSTDTSNTAASGALNDGQPTDSMGIPVGPTITSMMPDGTVSIQDARVPPIMSKLMLRVIESATDRLRRGIGLDDLADRIERYYNGYSARLGLVNGIIRDAMEKIGFREKKLAMTTFEQYMRERENGRTAEAKDIYDNATEAGRALIDAWNKIAVETGRINTSLVTRDGKPLRVFDSQAGSWRKIGMVKDFFPRTFRQEVMQVMKNPDIDPVLHNQLLDALVVGGFAADRDEAKEYINREWFSDEVKQDYFAGVEKGRTDPLPEIFYDYSWDAAVRYMNKWARRTSQVEQFGQKISQFENDWFDTNIPKVRDDRTQAYLNDIKKIIYENETFGWLTNMMAYLNSIATATQLGNPVSAFQNLLGGTISSTQEFGLKEVGKAYFELVRDWKNVQKTGTTLGILNTDVMRILSDHVERESDKYFSQEQKVSMALAKFANVMLTFGGYNGAENIVRAMTLIAAQGRLNSFLRDVNNNLNSKNVRNFMEWAKRQRIDTDALLIEDGQGPETERYLRRAVNVPQGSYKIDMTPVFVDQPIGRFLFKYQKFGTQMNRFFYQNFLKPFADKPSPRNFFRIVSFLGIAVLGGTAMLAFREALGYGDPGPDDEELKKALENKDTSRFFSLMFSRAWQSIMAAGSFGFFGNYAQLAYDWQDQQRVKNPMSPPGLSSVNGIADIINRGIGQGKFTARDLDEVMEANLSAYRASKRATLATADGFGSDAREVRRFAAMRDQREIDEYTRRYASEMDIEFKRRTAPGAIVRTPMTPANKAITDALRQGDSARARALIRQATREAPFNERERVERSIKASVRNRQPIRIGGSAPSAEQKQQFLQWARRNLPIEAYQKIVSADRQYSNAANRAGVGFSGED